jgi:hypothetical protein
LLTERLTKRSLAIGLAALAAAGCLAGCAGQRDAAWLEQLRAREAGEQPLQEVGSADGSFAARVAAAPGSIEPGDEADYVVLGIGGETPIECVLYHDEVESASTLQTSAASVFAELEERYGAAVRADVERLDAGAIGAGPFLQLYWSYRIARPEGEVFGELKQMIASREGRSVYCLLHDNGYARSFERVFRELVGSMRFSSYDQLRPYFTQIDVLSSEGRRFGFVNTSVALEEDGEPRIVRYTAELNEDADGALSARDVTTVEHSTVAGVLRGKIFTDYRDGEVASALVLENAGDAGWELSGEQGGEAVRSVLDEADLWSWIGGTAVLRRVVAGETTESGVRFWEPQVATERCVARRYSRLEALPENLQRISIYTGGDQTVAAVGGDGLIRSETDVGADPAVMRERVYVEGALR